MFSNRVSKSSWILLPAAGAIVLIAALFIGDASQARAAAPQEGGELEVLAKVGDAEITRAEVESHLASEMQRLERERHELLEKGMEQAIERRLVDLEAAARGVSRQDLLTEVYSGLSEPSDEAVNAFYEARKGQINRPLDDVRAQIINYLRQQDRQRVYNAFIEEVRGRHGVSRYLEPMRVEVASADGAPAIGPSDAPVTIVEFSDFQCPYCQRLAPTIDQVVENYGDKVRVVFRQFPLPIHADAQKAAEASLCAAEEGKFWEMHDSMFANIRALGVEQLKEKAAALELDSGAFAECLDSGRHATQVAQDLAAGREAGVTGTPAMFINGRFISGAVPYEQIAAVIDDELERESRQ